MSRKLVSHRIMYIAQAWHYSELYLEKNILQKQRTIFSGYSIEKNCIVKNCFYNVMALDKLPTNHPIQRQESSGSGLYLDTNELQLKGMTSERGKKLLLYYDAQRKPTFIPA
ncbi:MAG: hypothetical protein JXA42_11650 [Anaerolineales bacterium]|nr:hypothetical protein [Anaerolineales bacterium]